MNQVKSFGQHSVHMASSAHEARAGTAVTPNRLEEKASDFLQILKLIFPSVCVDGKLFRKWDAGNKFRLASQTLMADGQPKGWRFSEQRPNREPGGIREAEGDGGVTYKSHQTNVAVCITAG